MEIIDSQVHVWAPSTPERPWSGTLKEAHGEKLMPDELLARMDEAGVAAAVLVPPNWEGHRNDIALAAAKAHPKRFAIMGRLLPDMPPSPGILKDWRKQQGMLGLRFSFRHKHLEAPLVNGSFDWLWPEAEREQAHLMLLVSHSQLKYVEPIAARHPGLKIIIDHLGLEGGHYDAEAFTTLDTLLASAKYPNIAVKASAVPAYTRDKYPFRALHPYLKRIIDAYGPKRVFWGTDLSRLPCTYKEAIGMITEGIDWLTPDEKAWIMGRGICEWLDWKR